jgi:hypothetical protein
LLFGPDDELGLSGRAPINYFEIKSNGFSAERRIED